MFPEKPAIPADSIVPVEPGYFRPPVDIAVGLGGTFGELRSNHFHAGIDIRTNGQEGLTIRACADGFVSRIKVSPYGYGNALYIDHPNGYTTVYAHLKSFAEPIAAYVKQAQYADKSFAIDVYPEDSLFPVTQGMKIALSGNSGRSTSPHLHFEIRETDSEWPVNPLLITDWVKDDIPPVITKLWVSTVSPPHETATRKSYSVVQKSKGRYGLAAGDTIQVTQPLKGFAVQVTDRHTGNSGNNDISALQYWENGVLRYGYNLKKFCYDDTRYLNAHADFALRSESSVWAHRLHRLPGNRLPAYVESDSVVNTGRPTHIRVVAMDGHGNASTLEFFMRRQNVSIGVIAHGELVHNDSSFVALEDDFAVRMQPRTFYEPTRLQVNTGPWTSGQGLSFPLTVSAHESVPVHRYFDVSIRLLESALPSNWENMTHQLLIRRQGGGAYESNYVDGWVHASPREFGTFYIDIDTVAPRLTLISSSRSAITFTITDNLSGIDDYDAYIDGQWVLPVYDAKTNRVTHKYETSLATGKHEFKLVVTDAVGNVAEETVEVVR
jgi:hypothetical protein